MQITDIIAQAGGLKSMSRELGVSEAQVQSGVAALLPALMGGFRKQAQAQQDGASGLAGMLGKLGGAALRDEVLSSQPTNVDRGNAVLGQIFGSKDVSRAVAQHASAQSGLDASVLKKMLPMLAMLVGGSMAAESRGGGLGGLLGGLLGGKSAGLRGAGSGAPASGLMSLLDQDGDGNPLDDIMRMMGKGGA